ncbi:hypothetical protein [Candidatus Phytoplasma solani]|uniref:hypothetical protein n=1 Tax=Candidatus Phytoplasma solani TaxID=69896 RepID=UPI00358E7055
MQSDKIKEEIGQSRKVVTKIEQTEQSVIDEYKNIIEELENKRNKIEDIPKLERKQYKLVEELEIKNVEIENAKEELKNKNPNYARAQQRLKDKRRGKIPEIVMIPNK